jgi:uncharacterized protein YndB with AHSA1/START domain
MPTTVTSEQFINASLESVYLAFTRSLWLHEWLCDFATVNPRPGGRMYLWWNGDFYSAGEYVELEPNKTIKFTWHARSEPTPSEVTVTLKAIDEGTHVLLTHTVPDGHGWKERATGFKTEWDSTLPNLASVLETGLDRRIFDRPMLGISINDFSSEIAKASGVPVSEGIRLADVAEGMGARAAGLRKDDVIVTFNGKHITNDFGSLSIALQGTKGGDKVQVEFYRGPEKHSVIMELSKRPVPDIPWDPQDLANQVRARYDTGLALLGEAFTGTTEAEVNFVPAQGEWSAIQTLAHLVHTERNWLANIDDVVGGFDRNSDDFGGNINIHINATIIALGGVAGMLDEMKRLSVEVTAYLANLPPEFVARKNSYLNIGNVMLNGMLPHTQTHIEQIQAALAATRKQ